MNKDTMSTTEQRLNELENRMIVVEKKYNIMLDIIKTMIATSDIIRKRVSLGNERLDIIQEELMTCMKSYLNLQ